MEQLLRTVIRFYNAEESMRVTESGKQNIRDIVRLMELEVGDIFTLTEPDPVNTVLGPYVALSPPEIKDGVAGIQGKLLSETTDV